MSIILIRWSPGIHSEIRNATMICIKRQAESTEKAEARRKKGVEAQAAKRATESTQEADARRKKEAEAQAAKRQAEST